MNSAQRRKVRRAEAIEELARVDPVVAIGEALATLGELEALHKTNRVRRKRGRSTKLLGETTTVWKVVRCDTCGATVGERCSLPDGTTRKGSHMVRLRRLWLLRRRRTAPQLDLFGVEVL